MSIAEHLDAIAPELDVQRAREVLDGLTPRGVFGNFALKPRVWGTALAAECASVLAQHGGAQLLHAVASHATEGSTEQQRLPLYVGRELVVVPLNADWALASCDGASLLKHGSAGGGGAAVVESNVGERGGGGATVGIVPREFLVVTDSE